MSLTKRIFIDRDPAYAEVRRKAAEEIRQHLAAFTHRLPTRRRNRWSARPHWDPLWPSSLAEAARELGIESVNVNDGMLFRTAVDRDAVKVRAEELWQVKVQRFRR